MNSTESHLQQVSMTYQEHKDLSLQFAASLFMGSLKAVVHAFFPNAFVTSTSELVAQIQERIQHN